MAIQSVANHSSAGVPLPREESQSRPQFFVSREIDMSRDLIVSKFKHMFRRFDVDGSGTVNRLDFQMETGSLALAGSFGSASSI